MTEDRSVLSRPARAPERVLAYGPDSEQVIDVYPGRLRHALLLIHGGYWRPEYDRMHLRPMASALADAGWTTYLIEYRRQPGQPRQMTRDVLDAIEAAAADAGAKGLIVIGHSAGGHLALVAAAQDPARVHAVIALAPVSDLGAALSADLDEGAARVFLGEVPSAEHCPICLPTPQIPVVVLHGDADGLVPIELSRGYSQAHPRTRLVELPGVAHFALIDPQSSSWPVVLEAIDQAAPAGFA